MDYKNKYVFLKKYIQTYIKKLQNNFLNIHFAKLY